MTAAGLTRPRAGVGRPGGGAAAGRPRPRDRVADRGSQGDGRARACPGARRSSSSTSARSAASAPTPCGRGSACWPGPTAVACVRAARGSVAVGDPDVRSATEAVGLITETAEALPRNPNETLSGAVALRAPGRAGGVAPPRRGAGTRPLCRRPGATLVLRRWPAGLESAGSPEGGEKWVDTCWPTQILPPGGGRATGDPGARSRRDRLGRAPRRHRGRQGAGARRPPPHRSPHHRLGGPSRGLPVGRQRRDRGRRSRCARRSRACASACATPGAPDGPHRDAGPGLRPGGPRRGDRRLPARAPGGRGPHAAGPPPPERVRPGARPRPRSSGADRPTARSATSRSPGPRRAGWRSCSCRPPRRGSTPS